MSSLWTPDGERPVPRPGASGAPGAGHGGDRTGPSQPPPGGTAPPGGTEPGAGSRRDGPQLDEGTAAEIERLRREVAATPASVVVANHAYGLFELAALYLSTTPPRLDDATLAIDSLAGLMAAVEERLGERSSDLKEGLRQLQLAYIQVAQLDQTDD